MAIMAVIAIPRQNIDPSLIDPHYGERFEITTTQRAPSYPALPIGQLAKTATFSAPLQLSPNISELGWSAPKAGYGGEETQLDIREEDGDLVYEIPDALGQFDEAIKKIAAHEHAAYPNAARSAVYLTIRQSLVWAGVSQISTPEFHRDTPLSIWSHVYTVSDTDPTLFMSSDEAIADRQLNKVPAANSNMVMTPKPYEIVFANGTTFHSSPELKEDSLRTFLRIIYEHALEP